MNHRDERRDWPTSTTALALCQRGQGNGAAGGPLEVIMARLFSDYRIAGESRVSYFETVGQTNRT